MEDKLLKIISYYGIKEQLKYIHSEYFELDEAILNCGIKSLDNKHIAEEIADVIVMLKQFQYYYGISDEQIEEIMNYKIQRQLDRIRDE